VTPGLSHVAELNAEALRLNTGVKYGALANKIEVTGDIHRAANCTTSLGGWFLRRAARAGYFDGEEWALGTVNSQWRRSCASVPKENPNKSPDTFCLPDVYSYRKNPMNSFRQILATIYVALAEAAGGPAALRRANQVLRDAIADGAADDPTAIMLLESLAHDEDDEDASEIVDLLDDLAVASIH
jgi:hypothetical protein